MVNGNFKKNNTQYKTKNTQTECIMSFIISLSQSDPGEQLKEKKRNKLEKENVKEREKKARGLSRLNIEITQ